MKTTAVKLRQTVISGYQKYWSVITGRYYAAAKFPLAFCRCYMVADIHSQSEICQELEFIPFPDLFENNPSHDGVKFFVSHRSRNHIGGRKFMDENSPYLNFSLLQLIRWNVSTDLHEPPTWIRSRSTHIYTEAQH